MIGLRVGTLFVGGSRAAFYGRFWESKFLRSKRKSPLLAKHARNGAPRPHRASNNLEYIPRQILILHDVGEHFAHEIGVDDYVLTFSFWSFEAEFIEHALHDGMQAAGTDIFRTLIHAKCEVRDLLQGLGSELQLHSFSLKQRR